MSSHTQTLPTVSQLALRKNFPLLQHQPGLHYLDNASTTQQPEAVLRAHRDFVEHSYASPHRTVYDLGVAATQKYEGARQVVAEFLAAEVEGIIFTANATAALNLAAAIEAQRLESGDEIILSVAEHHSNMLPWRAVATQRHAKIVWLENVGAHHIDLSEFRSKLSSRTKVVAVAHISNVLGSIAPLRDIVALAHAVGARVVVDAAQSAARLPLAVQEVGIDYLALSAHKMYGPTGLGVLYARPEYLQAATPVLVGGGMVAQVSRDTVTWHQALPQRWEAGTPHTAGAVGTAAAVHYLNSADQKNLWQQEQALTTYVLEKLEALPFVRVVGPPADRAGIFSFTLEAGGRVIHSHDVVSVANQYQVALRGGHHCAEPLMHALKVSDLTRASLAAYSTREDIDVLCDALTAAHRIFSP